MYKIFIPSRAVADNMSVRQYYSNFFFVIHLVLQLSGLTFDSYRANSLTSQHTMVLFVYHFHSLCKRDLFIFPYPYPIHH